MFPRLASLRAFSHRSYLWLWVGAFVSNVGNWMQVVALGVFVTETTGKAGWTGTVTALTYLPALVLGPFGGALADRVDRRRYLLAGCGVQALLSAALAALALAGRLSLVAVAVAALAAGCVTAMTAPAFNALLVDLVPGEDLFSAVSLNSAQFNLGRTIGPLLAAVVMAQGGVGWTLAAHTASFVGVLLALALVEPSARVPGLAEPIWAGIRRGLGAALADARIRDSLAVTLLIGALVAPFIGLVPVMAIKLLGGGAAETSLLVTCQGAGAVCAALVVGTLAERLGPDRVRIAAAFAAPCLAVGYWLAPGLAVAGATLVLLGGAYLTCLSALSTRIQTNAPKELQGRIASLYGVLLAGGYAVGLTAQGWLGDYLGMRAVGAGAAAACLLGLVAGRLWARAATQSAGGGAGSRPRE